MTISCDTAYITYSGLATLGSFGGIVYSIATSDPVIGFACTASFMFSSAALGCGIQEIEKNTFYAKLLKGEYCCKIPSIFSRSINSQPLLENV